MAQDLPDAFDAVIRFLEQHDVAVWPKRLRDLQDDCRRLTPGDVRGWRHFFAQSHLFGGMGALDDLVINSQSGHRVRDENAANFQFEAVLRQFRQVWDKYRQQYQAMP